MLHTTLYHRVTRATHVVALTFLLAASAHAQAAPPNAVPSVRTMQDIPGAHEKPDPAQHYKILFNVKTMIGDPDRFSPELEAIGGIVNTYRKYGVPADHLEVTAVFHGATIVLVARDAEYRRRTGAAGNPNLALLGELAGAGVQLVVCGQSALGQHYTGADLIPAAQMNLSATITFINLQTRGFVKVDL